MVIMKKTYRTKQKEIVLEAVKLHEGTHFSVEDIYDSIRSRGINLGRATVYRHINALQNEGLIKRFIVEFGKSMSYEYSGCEDRSCYHFKCVKCNRLLHIQCQLMDEVKQHLAESHNFSLDDSKMIFTGICGNCQE